jgi:hypothetical protein
MKNERIQALVVAFLAAGIFYLIDRIVLDVTIAPLWGVLLLFALSLIFRPSSLALVLTILVPYVIFSLTQASSFNMEHKESVQRLIVRSGSFYTARSSAGRVWWEHSPMATALMLVRRAYAMWQ